VIFLGKIIKIRGNKGEVVVAPSHDLDGQSLVEGDLLVLQSTKYTREKSLHYFKEINGASVFKFKDTHTINDAFKLVGYSIFANKSGAQNTNIDITDFTVKDMGGHLWGSVSDIETSSYNTILKVKSPDGDIIYVPLADDIVKKIDKKQKVILIDPPEGLKDLNKT
jgi:16S rRNA processing protein RimM